MLSWHPATSHPSHSRAWSALRGAAPLAGLLCAALLVLAACAPSGNTTSNTGNHNGTATTAATSTTAPTATTKPKPTAVPQITLAFCQGLVSLSDANNIMKPAHAATTIVPDNARPGGSCTYSSGSQLAGIPLTLGFQPFPAGTSLNAIVQQAIAQAEAKGTIPPGTTFSTAPVSGVGDQAVYGIVSGSFKGVTGFYAALDTTVGSVWISCFNFGEGSPTIPQQPALTQVCTQVVSRL